MSETTYKPSITASKGLETGTATTIVTGIAATAVDILMPDADVSTKGVVVGVLSGVLLAGYRAIRNWLKHRKD